MVAAPSKSFLTKKAGPIPVWGWGLGGVGLAYAYSRYTASKASTASTTASTTASEPASGSPYFLIENNEPGLIGGSGANPGGTSVAVTPPGTGSSPPVIYTGGNPPQNPITGGGVPTMGGTSVTPGEVIQPPVEVKPGMSAATIAKQYGISTAHLQSANPGATFAVGTVVGVPYLVKSGMTVDSIAKAFGISNSHLEQYLPKNPT